MGEMWMGSLVGESGDERIEQERVAGRLADWVWRLRMERNQKRDRLMELRGRKMAKKAID